jgi:2-polyprenyl-6-methoxyphenol hydroxylase-like FAD-dependent oxidoreductase
LSRAIVIGGGLGGMLAAAVLAEYADVTVIEAHTFPDQPAGRRGLPQSPHNHMLLGGGADALDELLPGTMSMLYAAGAHRLLMADGLLTLSAQGWFRRPSKVAADDPYVVGCSRDLLDHVIRRQVATRHPSVTILQGTQVVGLAGSRERVSGVRINRDHGTSIERADFVADATGSRSRAPQWLAELGCQQVTETFVDPKLAYAGRIYQAPAGIGDQIPGVLIQPEPATGRPGRGAAFMPQENGRWIVSLMGTYGGTPSTEEDEFLAFAQSLRDPLIADLIRMATPVSPIRGARGLANRRRNFHQVTLPDGFLAVADSVMALSPNYATGMTLAGLEMLRLRDQLRTGGLVPGLGSRVQRTIAKLCKQPWTMATTTDCLFPGAETNISVRGAAKRQQMAAKYTRVAAENPAVLHAIYRVATLTGSQRDLMRPRIMAAALRGSRQPALDSQQAIRQFPELANLLTGQSVATEGNVG